MHDWIRRGGADIHTHALPPLTSPPPGPRPYAAAMMQKLTAEWLNATFPYWNRWGAGGSERGREFAWG